jgi:hypothetical protein
LQIQLENSLKEDIIMSTIWKQAAGTAMGVVIGLGMGAVMYARATPKQQAAPEVIRAQRFELVNEQGKAVGAFAVQDISQGAALKPEDFRQKLGISGKTVGLYLTPADPGSGFVGLFATPEGVGGLMVAGLNAKTNQMNMVMVGNDLKTPYLRLAIEGEHHSEKARTIKP